MAKVNCKASRSFLLKVDGEEKTLTEVGKVYELEESEFKKYEGYGLVLVKPSDEKATAGKK